MSHMSDGLLARARLLAIVRKRVSSLVAAGLLVLFALSFSAAVPASAATSPSGSQYVWATLNALGYGNYPGGNEEFTVFVVNSDSPPLGNMSLLNETLTAPALPPSSNTGSAIGLPVQLSSGQAILSTIYLPIPSNSTQSSFTATVVINIQIANGTSFFSKQLTESTTVVMLSLPGTATSSSSTTSTASSSQSTTQSSGVSSGLFYAGVGVPSVVAIILLALLARGRGRPQPSPRATSPAPA
jgi:hypothetical protein